MPRRRILNWDNALVRWSKRMRGQPFKWGHTDCCAIARQAMDLIFEEPIIWIASEWNDKASALRGLKEKGGIRKFLIGLGAEVHPMAFSHAGDIAVFPYEEYVEGCAVIIRQNYALGADPSEGVIHLVPYNFHQDAVCLRL